MTFGIDLVISVLGGLLSAVILYFRRSYVRKKGIKGLYKGSANQPIGPESKPDESKSADFELELILKPSFFSVKRFHGEAILSYVINERPQSSTLLLNGNLMSDEKTVLIRFKDSNPEIHRFGTYMLTFYNGRSVLKGKFLAYAEEMREFETGPIVTGTITLERR